MTKTFFILTRLLLRLFMQLQRLGGVCGLHVPVRALTTGVHRHLSPWTDCVPEVIDNTQIRGTDGTDTLLCGPTTGLMS